MAESKLLSHLRSEIRRRNYSYRTERAYESWVKRYLQFHHLKHPTKLSEKHVVTYLSYLANKRNVAASTQNQALCAIVFLYEQVLHTPLDDLSGFDRAKKPSKLPVVMNRKEVKAVFAVSRGKPSLYAPCFMERGCVYRSVFGCGCRTWILNTSKYRFAPAKG